MRLMSTTVVLTTLLLTLPLLKVCASPPPIEVGPTNINTLPYSFAFTSQDRDGLVQFGVTVTPKKDRLSPGLLARLHLMDAKTKVATIPLEETREGSKVTYWFQIAPAFLAKSRFEFDILSGKEETLPNGTTRFIAEPGTLEYDFNIRDYVSHRAGDREKVDPHPIRE
jgi:hypothetical protein